MNRKILFLMLAALIAGGVLGHAAKSRTHTPEQASSPLTKQDGSPARFGDKRAASPENAAPGAARSDGESDIDQLISKYSRMKGAELLTELEKLESKKHSDGRRNANSMNSVLRSYLGLKLGQTAPVQALQKIKNSSYEHPVSHFILTGWREKNPDALLAYCTEQIESGNSNIPLQVLQKTLMTAKDPEKTLNDTLKTPSMEQYLIIRNVLSQWIKNDPQKAAEAIKKSQDVFLKNEWTYQGIAGDWANNDWDSAVQWINTLPGDKKHKALAAAIATLPLEEAAARLNHLDEKGKEIAIRKITSDFALKSPLKALEWLSAHATEEQAAVASRTLDSDRILTPEVMQYVDEMPSGQFKDSVLEQMVNRMRIPTQENEFLGLDKKSAADIAAKISSPEKRKAVLDGLDGKRPFRPNGIWN